jgi:cobalt-zinc-cadmium efflux system protein
MRIHSRASEHLHPDVEESPHQYAVGVVSESTRRKLLFAVSLTAVVLVAEVVGGIWSGSLALISDAAHVLTDLISLTLSLGAFLIAARPVSKERTFGWHRAEVFAALVNGLLLFLITAGLLRAAIIRLYHPPEVRLGGMMVIAVAGLIANGLIAWRLRGHAHEDLNVRSAYLHVLADLGGSVGVVVAALIMLPTGWYIADPIISILIALAIFAGSIRLLRDTAHILLEGVPAGLDFEAVAEAVSSVPGVLAIHDLHIWTICSNLLALSVHATVGDLPAEERDRIVCEINQRLSDRFDIAETTVQTESVPCRTEALIHIVPHAREF